jgi:hypothetical protein
MLWLGLYPSMGGGIMAKSSPFLPRHMCFHIEPYCKIHPSYLQTCFTNRSPVSELQDIPRWCNGVRQHNLKEVAVQWLSWLCSYPYLCSITVDSSTAANPLLELSVNHVVHEKELSLLLQSILFQVRDKVIRSP